jgi:Tfp pilus assembly protein PilP
MTNMRLSLIALVAFATAASAAYAQSSPQTQKPAPAAKAEPAPQSQKPAPAAKAEPAPQAQKPAVAAKTPEGRGAATPAEDIAAAQQLIEPTGFDYKPDGRRDPFVSLVRRTATAKGATTSVVSRAGGIGGLAVDEVTLRGTIRGREGFVAMIQGADQKTYIVRPGDKLSDGMIRTITQSDMLVVQQVNDPLSLEKQREVRKVLRQTEANP